MRNHRPDRSGRNWSSIDDRIGSVVSSDLLAESEGFADRFFGVGHEAVFFDIEHRDDVSLFEFGGFDEVAGLLFSRGAVSEEMVGSPCDADLFELFAVAVVGRVDDKGSFGCLDDDEEGFFGFGDFFPIDVLLMA